MTRDQLQSIQDDLAYMKALAQEGRRAPLLGGSVLVVAGCTFAPAAVASWAISRGLLGRDPFIFNWVWLAAAVVFLGFLFWSKERLRTRPGASGAGNRAMGAAWGGLGFAAFALFGAFFAASWLTGEWIIMSMFGPVILAFYGAAWSVAATMSDRGWLKGVAGAAMLSAFGVGALAGRPEQWLAYAAALVLVALLPGLALMRQAPAEVV